MSNYSPTAWSTGMVITATLLNNAETGIDTAHDEITANYPLTTLGDILYDSGGAAARLAGNITTTRKFLRQTGNGSVSAAPAWDTVTKTDVGLANVENTALSTWAGTANITTVGTITTGTWSGSIIALNKGGTNAALTASNGGIVYSTASALAILAGTATAGQILRSGASAAPSWSTATYPATAGTSGNVLTSDGTNWTSAAPADKVYRVGHTYAIPGEIKVPSGDTDFVIPFFVSLASGQTAQLVKVRYKINSGTSVTAKLTKNGVDITGFTSISVTSTAAETDPADVALADNDVLALVVTAVSGTPKNLSFTLFIEYTQ